MHNVYYDFLQFYPGSTPNLALDTPQTTQLARDSPSLFPILSLTLQLWLCLCVCGLHIDPRLELISRATRASLVR